MAAVMLLIVLSGINVFAEDSEAPDEDQAKTCGYVMEADGEEIMIVKKVSYAKSAIKTVVKKMVPKNSKFKSYKVTEKIKYTPIKAGLLRAGQDIEDTKSEAAKELYRVVRSKKSPITIKITSYKHKYKKTKIRIKFKYKKNMFPYEFKVKTKGTNGKKRTTFKLTSVNGKITKKVKHKVKVKRGKYRIVLTGKKKNPKNLSVRSYKKYKKRVIKKTLKKYGDVFLGRELVAYGMKFLGNPYRVGGKSLTHGIDCVQFVRALYKKFGINLPGNRTKLFHTGKTVSYKNARPGDVVFYGKHPAVYIGNGKIISARHKGICVSSIHYKKYTYIRRIK